MTVAEVGVLSPERVAAIAKDNLNEDPARVKNDIKAIKEWIKKQPHLHKNVNTGTTDRIEWQWNEAENARGMKQQLSASYCMVRVQAHMLSAYS